MIIRKIIQLLKSDIKRNGHSWFEEGRDSGNKFHDSKFERLLLSVHSPSNQSDDLDKASLVRRKKISTGQCRTPIHNRHPEIIQNNHDNMITIQT